MGRWLATIVGLLGALPAAAAPVWLGTDGGTFHAEAYQALPVPIWLPQTTNAPIRVDAVYTRFVATCTPDRKDPRAVGCVLDDVALSAQPWTLPEWGAGPMEWPLPTGHRALSDKLDELDAELTGRAVRLQLDADGRPKSLELLASADDPAERDGRRETLGLLLLRAFAGLDVPPPIHGTLSTYPLIGYPLADASLVEARVIRTGSTDTQTTEAVGRVRVEAGLRSFDAQVIHEARVEEAGELVATDWRVVATPAGPTRIQSTYVQVGAIRAIAEDPPPDLGVSEAIFSVPTRFTDAMTEAWALSRRLQPYRATGTPPPPEAAHVWFRIAGGAATRADGATGAAGLWAGWRTPWGLRLGGGTLIAPHPGTTAYGERVEIDQMGAEAVVTWQSTYVLGPRLGLAAGATRRTIGGAEPGTHVVGTAGVDLGFSLRLRPGWYLDASVRGQSDLRTVAITRPFEGAQVLSPFVGVAALGLTGGRP